jgi:hypothetical protein
MEFDAWGASGNAGRARSCAFSVVILAMSVLPWQAARADNLSNFIGGLYGGKGINLKPVTGEDHHFDLSSTQGLFALNSSIGGSVPATSFNSVVVGATYDIAQGLPVRSVESLGPLVSERAETLGAGVLNVGISYGQAKFKRFNGTRLDQLSLTPVCGTGCEANEEDHIVVDLNVNVEKDVAGVYFTYGITSRWDIGLIVPFVHVRAKAIADTTFSDLDNDGEVLDPNTVGTLSPDQLHAHSENGGTADGIGDVVVRTKYNFVKDQQGLPDFSVVGQVTAPTGDKNNLLGSGSTDVLGVAVISKQFGRLAPHLNLGYEVASGGFDRDNFRYAAGADMRVSPEVTLAVDVVGRDESGGQNLSDLALGAKWGLIEQGLISANIIFPINRDTGLRPDFAWSLGFELNF